MEIDQSLVFPLLQGTVAKVDFGQSLKRLTGYFDGHPKLITEVGNLTRMFEQCITCGNWTHHIAVNNFSQILTGYARSWLELIESV